MNYITVGFLSVICILIGSIPTYCQVKDATPELRGLLPGQAQTAAPAANVENQVTISIERDYIPLDHMRGLIVKIDNQSPHAILVNCDEAKVTLPQQVADLSDLDNVFRPPTGFKAVLKADTIETVTAAFTVGAVQTIEGIKLQKGPILKRYGGDEQRRQTEAQRFGKRLLWPGEVSSGTIFFKTDQPLIGSKLEVPLSLPFRESNSAPQIISVLVPN